MTSESRAILEANLSTLGPSTRLAIDEADDGTPAQVESSSTPPGSVMMPDGRSVRLHSARNPVEEAETLLEPYLHNRVPLLIVLGLGFGYALEALEKRWPETRVLWPSSRRPASRERCWNGETGGTGFNRAA